tara:strand:- start:632 stop:967 length:336 start_codon:yes stop_codon:yes gene_type:complete
MGLRTDIYNAIAENLTYTDADGELVNPADELGKGGKLDKLAFDLTKAITEYVARQEFVITEMNAPVMTAMGPGVASLSREGKGMTGLPLEPLNTYVTKVKAEFVKPEEILP